MTQVNENLRNLLKRGDATSSWSGFTYQGNITIYTAICLLNKIGNNIEEIEKYEIEIEKHEDFSILYNQQIISLHQVKSYQNKDSIAAYIGALLELFAKALEFSTVKEISLHTATEIDSFTEEELKESIINFSPGSISDSKKKLYKDTKEKLFDESKFHSCFEMFKINSDSSKYIPIERSISLEEVAEKIQFELQKFYFNYDHENHLSNSPEQYEYAYLNLLKKINEKVAYIHAGTETKYSFKLIDFCKIIYDRNIFNLTNETISNFLMRELNLLFQQYLEDNSEDEKYIEINQIWAVHRELLEKLSSDDFILLCRRLSPENNRIPIGAPNIETYRNLLLPQGVIEILFFSLFELSHKIIKGESVKTLFTLYDDNVHLITLIYRKNVEMVGRDILKNLMNDKKLYELLFDIKFYLTSTLDGVYKGKRSDTEYEVLTSNGTRVKEKFMLPKQLHFVSKTTISRR